MAKAKKKSNTKKTTSTKSEAKTTATATSKNGAHEKHVAPEKHKTTNETKHVSENVENSNKGNPWVVVSAILGIIIILLVAGISSLYFNQDNQIEKEKNETPTNNNNAQTGSVVLTIVEDPSCVNCQVDLFASQIKENLISNLEVVKVNYESEEGKKIIEEVGAKQVPVYLFSKNIEERSDWEEQLMGAFTSQDIEGTNYYMLNPELVQGKAMISAPPILEGSIVVGDENAPVTVMQFTDFECPFCAIADGNPEMVEQFQARSPGYVAPMPKVYEEYVDSGKVKVVFYNFPIPSLHPEAIKSHNAVLCANEQDKFEEFSEKLWMDRDDWIEASNKDVIFKSFAQELSLDETQFNECYDSSKYNSQIAAEQALGQELGVSGTPAFFIGKTFISGAQDFDTFKSIIDAQLEAQN